MPSQRRSGSLGNGSSAEQRYFNTVRPAVASRLKAALRLPSPQANVPDAASSDDSAIGGDLTREDIWLGSASIAIPSAWSPIRWNLAGPIALVIRHEPIVFAVHQGRGDHEVGRGPVAGNGGIPHYRHSQERLHVGIVRKGLEWIPEED